MFLTDLFLLDIVIICSTDPVIFYLWRNIPTYLPNFNKRKTKFCWSFYYNSDNSYFFVNEKEIYVFKASNINVDFLCQFCLGSISNKFDYVDSEEVFLKGNMYNFSVDYNSVAKSDI